MGDVARSRKIHKSRIHNFDEGLGFSEGHKCLFLEGFVFFCINI
jgi:hypothetical protein